MDFLPTKGLSLPTMSSGIESLPNREVLYVRIYVACIIDACHGEVFSAENYSCLS
jgi:hypothetical protein